MKDLIEVLGFPPIYEAFTFWVVKEYSLHHSYCRVESVRVFRVFQSAWGWRVKGLEFGLANPSIEVQY